MSFTALDLTDDERAVLDVLDRHRGRAAAITKEALAAACARDERKVRQVIVRLIEQHGAAIGSTSSQPGGYFLIQTQDEQREAEEELQHRIMRLAQRLAKLKRNTPSAILDQLRLALHDAVATDEEETIG